MYAFETPYQSFTKFTVLDICFSVPSSATCVPVNVIEFAMEYLSILSIAIDLV